jgi:hypothetical protein
MQVRTDFVQSFKQHCIKGDEHARGAVEEASAAPQLVCSSSSCVCTAVVQIQALVRVLMR